MKRIIVQGRPFALEPCGIRNFSINFFSALSKKLSNYKFDILVPEKVEKDAHYFKDNVEFIVKKPVVATPNYLSTLLWENNQTLDYVKTIPKNEIAFYLSPYNCLPLTKLEIPEFIVLHDIDLWIDRGINWAIERRFGYEIKKQSIYNADLILTISNFSKQEIDSYFRLPLNKTQVIYEDIDPNYDKEASIRTTLVLNKFGVKNGDYFLYIGGFEPRKNPEAIFKAYQLYSKTVEKPKKLLILGSFNERTKKQIKFDFANLGDNCIFITNPSTTSELISVYKHAFAFIYPSKYEGFGLQILEAQASGTPLIVSNIPTFKEIAGKGALYFDPNKAKEAAELMVWLEKNNQNRLNLIEKGYINRKRFSWQKTTELFIEKIKNYL